MKKGTKILTAIIVGVILIPTLTLTVWYKVLYTQSIIDQPPYFDLFIAEAFFDQRGSSIWERVPENEKRPIKWKLDSKQFEKLDTVLLSLTNISGEKFYYTSWGAPFTRLRQDLIIYRNGIGDTILFEGFGCGTGVYLAPLPDNEMMIAGIQNPLMFDPYTNYELGIESDTFPNQYKRMYGDSVSIKFSQATYSNPWNTYKSQMIFSDYITISTDKIIDNWRKSKFARLPKAQMAKEGHQE